METNERILKFIEYKGISVNAFEKSIGKSTNYVRNSKSFTSNVLAKIMVTYPELSIEWLITGKGSMLKVSNASNGINANYNGTFSEPVGVIVGGGHIGNSEAPYKLEPMSDDLGELINENVKLKLEIERLTMNLELKDEIIKSKDDTIENKNEIIKMKDEMINLLSKNK